MPRCANSIVELEKRCASAQTDEEILRPYIQYYLPFWEPSPGAGLRGSADQIKDEIKTIVEEPVQIPHPPGEVNIDRAQIFYNKIFPVEIQKGMAMTIREAKTIEENETQEANTYIDKSHSSLPMSDHQ
ncbi:hypothetical protein chiPu_0007972 [Chiloscyllium punctatum]|uniref:Uncharacterized protein n=1 Tax=Chiloscyllium punctatum TaxID=137246 RepID=A0A401SGR0_CHIPU|nr:hypothetical protein [Chiloscyllium punctatum]